MRKLTSCTVRFLLGRMRGTVGETLCHFCNLAYFDRNSIHVRYLPKKFSLHTCSLCAVSVMVQLLYGKFMLKYPLELIDYKILKKSIRFVAPGGYQISVLKSDLLKVIDLRNDLPLVLRSQNRHEISVQVPFKSLQKIMECSQGC